MLTLTGVGMVIGAGIFVITGQAAALYAGPAIVYSFVIAGIVCGFSALCYAEMTAMIPRAGSAYSYARTAFGPGAGWVIGWAIIAEYLFAVGAIGIGWSAYLQGVIADFGTGPTDSAGTGGSKNAAQSYSVRTRQKFSRRSPSTSSPAGWKPF
jgi:APA family basic amino acid/polyamine antiporter